MWDRSAFGPGRRAAVATVVAIVGATLAVAPAVQARASVPKPPGADRAAQVDRATAQLEQATGGSATVQVRTDTGLAHLVGATRVHPVPRPSGTSANDAPATQARGFLRAYGTVFGVDDQATQLRTDGVDGRTVAFQQVHQGVPVLGGELQVNLTSTGAVLSANGEISPDLAVDTTASLGAPEALAAAKQVVAKTHGTAGSVQEAPALWVYDPVLLGGPSAGPVRLVWRVTLASDAGADPFRDLVLVDAGTGGIALQIQELAEGKVRQVCDRNNVVGAAEACTGGYSRTEGQAATGNTDVDRAYDYAGDTYDFYFSRFGRDSLDNAGLTLKSTVKYCPDSANCPYENAYWNGAQMVYGAGFAAADDVVGHELTHGVTDFESHLFYYYQSGAINESLSDVFGEFIDQVNGAGTDTAGVKWQMGEDLPAIGAIRNMADPPAFGDPDRMGSANYNTGTADEGGVHTNSGVNNKAAFLMTDGGTFNGRTITGLGLEKAARIYYSAATNLLTSAADYQDLGNALQQACANLTGTAGITAGDCAQVTLVVQATEMNLEPPAAASTTEAPVCGAGTTPTDLFQDDLENTASGNWTKTAISGTQSFAYPQNPNVFSGFDATYATSGSTNIFGADLATTSNNAIARTANVTPPVGKTTYLRFRHAFDLEKTYDGGRVEYSTNNGSTWTDAGSLFTDNGYNSTSTAAGGGAAFSGTSHGYYSSRVNLTSLAGQGVRFRFRLASDSSVNVLGWFIDDVRVYTCDPSASAPGAPTIGTATAGNAQATLTWAAPGSDGGSAITGYTVTPSIGAVAQAPQVFSSTATTQTITGLTNGTSYTFTVAATNAVGTGAASAASNAVTPTSATVPGAPSITKLVPGNGSIAVTWTAPGSNGGSAITGYTVTPYDVADVAQTPVVFNSTATTQTITGLANGSAYRFTVAARNAVGTGTPSATSGYLSAGTPLAPGFVSAQPGSTTAKVGWFVPGTNGSAITGYVIVPVRNGTPEPVQTFAPGSNATVTGLTNGGSYTFEVYARNANGTGAQAVTAPITVGAPTSPGFPGAAPGTTTARVAWVDSVANGAPLQGYIITPYIGSVAQAPITFNSTARTQTITGLTSGVSYSFKVVAFNSLGSSPPAQTGVIVEGAPQAPGYQSAVPANGSAKVRFTIPAANSAPIDSYTVWPVQGSTVLPPQVFATPSATQLTVAGLTQGVTYTFRVAATNSVGTSPYAVTNSITVGAPTAPGFSSAQPGIGSAKVSWLAANDNGSAVTQYVVTPYIGSVAQAPQAFAPATSVTVTGLVDGTTYTFKVAAVNALGTGPQDTTALSIKVGTPVAPAFARAATGNASATVAWNASAANSSPITGYVITPMVGTTAKPSQVFTSTATSQVVTGLVNGTTYTFRVAAISAVGTGPYSTTAAVKVGTPTAPAKPTAVAGVGSATVTWVAPAANGSAITGYLVTPIKAGVAQAAVAFDASSTSRTISGLVAGSSYTFTVVAINAVGSSTTSPASTAVIPT